MTRRRPHHRPAPLVIEAPTLEQGAEQLAYLARLWQEFTGRERPA